MIMAQQDTNSAISEKIADNPQEVLAASSKFGNIAAVLPEDFLKKVASTARKQYEDDLASCEDYHSLLEKIQEITKYGRKGTKNYPFNGASNVTFPIIKQAAINFASMAYPALVPQGEIVIGSAQGEDPNFMKGAAAQRSADFMSYQLKKLIPNWEADTDKLVSALPTWGTMFRKQFFTPGIGIMNELVYPDQLIVNSQYSKNVTMAPAASQVYFLYPYEINQRVQNGIFTEIKPLKPYENEPDEFIEQHTWADLDNDGIPEPYIVTFRKDDEKIVRFDPRFDQIGIQELPDKRRIITPIDIFHKYSFIPDDEGGFYDIGFGHILFTMNDAVNTCINQLLDAGHLANINGGFIGSNARLSDANLTAKMGRWIVVQNSGGNLRDNIISNPSKEPSQVLYQLMMFLVETGNKLGGTASTGFDSVPANMGEIAALNVLEGGQRTISAVFKRILRSMNGEISALQRLNQAFLPAEVYKGYHGLEADPSFDFNSQVSRFGISSDPDSISIANKSQQAQVLMAFKDDPLINQQALRLRVLQMANLKNPQELMQPPPQPDPAQQQLQELQLQGLALQNQESAADAQKKQAEAALAAAKAQKTAADTKIDVAELQIKAEEAKTNRLEAVTYMKQQQTQQQRLPNENKSA